MTDSLNHKNIALSPYRLTTFEEALRALGPGSVALDLETYSINSRGGSDALDPARGEIRLVSLCTEKGPAQLLDHMVTPIKAGELAALFADREVILHNAAFDCAWLQAKFGYRPRGIYDTLIACRILSNGLTDSNSLGATIERYLGVQLRKDQGASDWGGLFLTADQLRYAADDVLHLHELESVLTDELHKAGLWPVFELEIFLLPVIEHMEQSGFYVSGERLVAVLEAARLDANRVAEAITCELGRGINPNSYEQLLGALAEKGIQLEATDEDTLAARPEPVCGLILEHRGAEMIRRQAQALLDAIGGNHRIHCRYHSLTARSGRFTASTPNLQQVNRAGGMRAAFCAPAGRVLVILDFSQIELRIAAVLAGDQVMLEAFLRGEDLHVLTASRVLGRPSGEVTKTDRQTAKAVNFGLVYGQRGAGLCTYARTNYGVTLTLEQAEELRARFFATYTGLAQWHRNAWLRAPFVVESRTLLGRRRLARPDDTDWARWQLLINHSVQGTGADGLKRSLIRLFSELPPDTRLIACVHDEVILETSAQRAEQVKHWAKEVMTQEMSRLVAGVPIEVEAKVVENWGQK